MSDTSTHRADQICIDEQTRRATGTVQWLLEVEHACGTHPITSGNDLDVLMCGKDAFGSIAKSIEEAQDSIDIICWGFDPAMELVRSGGPWPRGQPYGSLLDAAAARGVKVRVLVWFESGAPAQHQNNMPGFTGDQRTGYFIDKPKTTRETKEALGITMPPPSLGGSDGRTPEELRHDYCVTWWREAMGAAKDATKGNRVEVRMRCGAKTKEVQSSLQGERDKPSSKAGNYFLGLAHEKTMIEDHATHHQKTVLIDYAHEGGAKAVGYVMGLNSVTDYWDTADHIFDTPLREVDWARTTRTAQALPANHPISRDPYQDYVCRVVGPALRGVHKNFVDAWKRAGGQGRADDADVLPPQLPKAATAYRAQIVRTQPQESDKTIRDTYFHAPQFARDYIYIENQYFFYEEWVSHLKETRQKFMQGMQDACKKQEESKMLHLFAVIPWPEDDGMVPRTYDMVKSLGEGSSMPNQHAVMQDKEKAVKDSMEYERQRKDIQMRYLKAGMDPTEAMRALPKPKNYTDTSKTDPLLSSAIAVKAPTKNHTTGELEGLGLKVLIGRLTTYNNGTKLPTPGLNYRQVYIHSKLMVIDDAFFTIGSANLNVRSMAADSEINIATDDHDQAGVLRRKVWFQHARGYGKTLGGDGGRVAIAAAFLSWQAVMLLNMTAMKKGEALEGYLVPFQEDRQINFRHG